MKKLSLRLRIAVIGIIPFVFFLFFAALEVTKDYTVFQEGLSLEEDIRLIKVSSALVHETQIERGLSVANLSGADNRKKLLRQRQKVDAKRRAVREILRSIHVDESHTSGVKEAVEAYESIRSQVDHQSASPKHVAKFYTEIVRTLFEVDKKVATDADFPVVAAEIRALAILEQAKENGGLLRAHLSGVLQRNTPISEETLNRIVTLRGGLISNLTSPGLVIDRHEQNVIDEFFKSAGWVAAEKTLFAVIKKASVGDYGVDSTEYFVKISSALDDIKQVIDYHKEGIRKHLLEEETQAIHRLIFFSVTTVILFVFLFWLIYSGTKKLTEQLSKAIEDLAEGAEKLSNVAKNMAASSLQLSDSSNKQAAGLHQTVAAADEISNMVSRNAENTRKSSELSDQSKSTAEVGVEKVEKTLKSMNDIERSNDEMKAETDESNRKIGEIVELIGEIGEKTEVINDIVFQTKLLSFNASVEATRAGEQGKGFAVVAEEVGSLASSSGRAAQEIASLLEESTRKAEGIVASTKQNIDRLMLDSSQKIEGGKRRVSDCDETLKELFRNVDAVRNLVSEIATASDEQAIGIKEITEAMGSLESVTQENLSLSKKTSELSTQLMDESHNVDHIVERLKFIIFGQKEFSSHNLEPQNVLIFSEVADSENSRERSKSA